MKELSYEEWRALTPKRAATYIAKRVLLPPEYKEKLEKILKSEWGRHAILQPQKETGPPQPKSQRARRRRKSVRLYKS